MIRRIVAPAFALVWLGIACLDISSPVTGIASTTPVLLPSPSVVVNDVSRDTAGNLDSLRVYAFAANGDTVRDARVVFFVIDSTHKLVVDSVSGIAHGEAISPIAQVVARITPANGKGAIQTPPVSYPVVPTPQRVTQDSNLTLFEFNLATDTLATAFLSAPISVTVHGGADTVIRRYVVTFELATSPPSGTSEPLVVLAADNGRMSVVDTTDDAGHASRRLRVRPSAIPLEVAQGGTVNAVVKAHVTFGKAHLTGSPVVFTIPIKAGF